MDVGSDYLICLDDAKDGHFTSKCPFMANFRKFSSIGNYNYLRKYGNILGVSGVYRGYRGGRGGRGGYYGKRSREIEGKDEDPTTPSTKQSETGTRTGSLGNAHRLVRIELSASDHIIIMNLHTSSSVWDLTKSSEQ